MNISLEWTKITDPATLKKVQDAVREGTGTDGLSRHEHVQQLELHLREKAGADLTNLYSFPIDAIKIKLREAFKASLQQTAKEELGAQLDLNEFDQFFASEDMEDQIAEKLRDKMESPDISYIEKEDGTEEYIATRKSLEDAGYTFSSQTGAAHLRP